MLYVCIAIAGALGALCRWGLSAVIGKTQSGFDAGTLFVNALGSFVLGLVAGAHTLFPDLLAQAILLGFCGGLTTFSTFALSAVSALEAGKFVVFGKEAVFNTVLCIFLVWSGMMAGGSLCQLI